MNEYKEAISKDKITTRSTISNNYIDIKRLNLDMVQHVQRTLLYHLYKAIDLKPEYYNIYDEAGFIILCEIAYMKNSGLLLIGSSPEAILNRSKRDELIAEHEQYEFMFNAYSDSIHIKVWDYLDLFNTINTRIWVTSIDYTETNPEFFVAKYVLEKYGYLTSHEYFGNYNGNSYITNTLLTKISKEELITPSRKIERAHV